LITDWLSRFHFRTASTDRNICFCEHEDIPVVKPKEEGQLSLTATMECTGLTTTINMKVIRPIHFEPEVIRIKPGETVRAPLFKGIEQIVESSRVVIIDDGLQVTREKFPRNHMTSQCE
jgi:hypothetical protein